jgi:hypothetical protein
MERRDHAARILVREPKSEINMERASLDAAVSPETASKDTLLLLNTFS